MTSLGSLTKYPPPNKKKPCRSQIKWYFPSGAIMKAWIFLISSAVFIRPSGVGIFSRTCLIKAGTVLSLKFVSKRWNHPAVSSIHSAKNPEQVSSSVSAHLTPVITSLSIFTVRTPPALIFLILLTSKSISSLQYSPSALLQTRKPTLSTLLMRQAFFICPGTSFPAQMSSYFRFGFRELIKFLALAKSGPASVEAGTKTSSRTREIVAYMSTQKNWVSEYCLL